MPDIAITASAIVRLCLHLDNPDLDEDAREMIREDIAYVRALRKSQLAAARPIDAAKTSAASHSPCQGSAARPR